MKELQSITIITDNGEIEDQTMPKSQVTIAKSILSNQKERGKEEGITLSTPEGLVTAKDIRIN